MVAIIRRTTVLQVAPSLPRKKSDYKDLVVSEYSSNFVLMRSIVWIVE